MADNPRKLKPGQLVRLLNSSPLGEVITERRLRSHRERAGLRIGDGRTVDLIRYAAWLAADRHAAPAPAPSADPPATIAAAAGYENKKERERARSSARAQSGRDISPIAAVADPKRRAACERNFRLFCETYFPGRFTLEWSDDHLKVIERIETTALVGGLFALAMPRGTGKTSLCECAAIWSVLFGHRQFVVLIGASRTAALELMESIKQELDGNDLLAADFPEVCQAAAAIDGIANRAMGQICDGARTHIWWGKDKIILPTIAGSAASGAIVKVAGITGRIRGMKHIRADGESARPDLVLIDDPQTDASAKSERQCAQRERIMAGAILGLPGPGKAIAAICPLTVILPGDMADHLLDRNLHPEWQGERTKMLYAWPDDMEAWQRYAEIMREELRFGGSGKKATAFYKKNRAAMDKGSLVAWPARKKPGELSALQSAMNLWIANPAAFAAEYQNDPEEDERADVDILTAQHLAAKLHGLGRGIVPGWATTLVCGIDVQKRLAYWMVAAFAPGYSGAVVDYGTWPRQRTKAFTARNAGITFAKLAPKSASLEGQIRFGLDSLAGELLGREWRRDDGGMMRIELALVDAGYKTETVHRFCRESAHAGIIYPSIGRGIGPQHAPISDYKRKPGETIGLNWIQRLAPNRAIRYVEIDVNWWKTFAAARLTAPIGDQASVSLFATNNRAGESHDQLIEHLTAERPEETAGRGRVVHVWSMRPGRTENHLWDTFVQCTAAASMRGIALAEVSGAPKKPKKRRRGGGVSYL